jgi:hypothetical protein
MVRATWGSESPQRRDGFCLEAPAHDGKAESTPPPQVTEPGRERGARLAAHPHVMPNRLGDVLLIEKREQAAEGR